VAITAGTLPAGGVLREASYRAGPGWLIRAVVALAGGLLLGAIAYVLSARRAA
jgi:hypothetical protein